jgi:hypothetical protein
MLASASTTTFGLLPNMDDIDWSNNVIIDVKKSLSWSTRKSDVYNASSGEWI